MERNCLDTVEIELKLRRLLFSSISLLMMNLKIHSQHSSGKSEAIVIAARGVHGLKPNPNQTKYLVLVWFLKPLL